MLFFFLKKSIFFLKNLKIHSFGKKENTYTHEDLLA